jgi:hypothetical protein
MMNFRYLILKQLKQFKNGKIKHNNFIDTVDEVYQEQKEEEVTSIYRR